MGFTAGQVLYATDADHAESRDFVFLGTTDVEPKTANYPVLAADSGKTFTNEGTTAKRNFTLPAAVAGLFYTFIVIDADGLTVTAAAGDTIRLSAAVSAAAGNTDSTTVGSVVRLEAINATEWIATSIVGTWVTT